MAKCFFWSAFPIPDDRDMMGPDGKILFHLMDHTNCLRFGFPWGYPLHLVPPTPGPRIPNPEIHNSFDLTLGEINTITDLGSLCAFVEKVYQVKNGQEEAGLKPKLSPEEWGSCFMLTSHEAILEGRHPCAQEWRMARAEEDLSRDEGRALN